MVSVHWGSPGLGKTTYVRRCIPVDSYWKDSSNKWFDGYEYEEHCVFDEFNGKWFTYSYLKRLLDFTPVRVEVKGSSLVFNSSFIHIISNQDPSTWYDNEKYPWMELHRRIEVCYKYNKLGEEPVCIWDHIGDSPFCPYKDCPAMWKHTKPSSTPSAQPPPRPYVYTPIEETSLFTRGTSIDNDRFSRSVPAPVYSPQKKSAPIVVMDDDSDYPDSEATYSQEY